MAPQTMQRSEPKAELTDRWLPPLGWGQERPDWPEADVVEEVAATATLAPKAAEAERAGLARRLAIRIADLAFQLGISGSGRLWYRHSQAVSAKEKAVLDGQMLGVW